jgi:hypothetical protein
VLCFSSLDFLIRFVFDFKLVFTKVYNISRLLSSWPTRASTPLTHIDMWGKYRISIHGNQYYIVYVDDRIRFTTLDFLKTKDQAVQSVKNYVTRLKTLGRNPQALRFDRGKEFINEDL